jgi:hypothetical protein
MAVRYLGNEDGLVEIGAPHRYEVGDTVFWATPSGTGELHLHRSSEGRQARPGPGGLAMGGEIDCEGS